MKNTEDVTASTPASGSDAAYPTFVARIAGACLVWMSFMILHTLPATKADEIDPKAEAVLALLSLVMFVAGVLLIRKEHQNNEVTDRLGGGSVQ